MSDSFKEVVRSDVKLMEILNISEKRAIEKRSVINVSDIDGLCDKITLINTKNPKSYSRRVAWTLTGRLLLGLTIYYEIHVKDCFDQSLRLEKDFNPNLFVLERKTTTKRRIKRTVTDPKTKKRRTIEVDEEIQHSQKIKFWEDPLILGQNETPAEDLNLVPDEQQITLREFSEPMVLEQSAFEAELQNDFGDESAIPMFDNDVEMCSFQENEPEAVRSQISMMTDFHVDTDENMNAIMAADIDELSAIGGPIADEIPEINATENEPSEINGIQEHSQIREDPLKELALLSPLKPLAVAALKKGKGKRRSSSVFKDVEKVIATDAMKKHIDNTMINSRRRDSIQVEREKEIKKRQTDIMMIPSMKSSYVLELFARKAKIKEAEETDWTITFDSGIHDNSQDLNGANISEEADILRNESQNERHGRIGTRTSIRASTRANTPNLLSSTPKKPSSQISNVDMVRNDQFNADTIQQPEWNLFENDDLFNPPSGFQDSPIDPPPNFTNNTCPRLPNPSNSPNQSIVHNESSFPPNFVDQNASEVDEIVSQPIVCPDLIALLGEDSLEYQTLIKLKHLWRRNKHPINVNTLLTPRCNRIQAAKTFAALLLLKKKTLIQLENSEDGKIVHISEATN